MKRLYFAIGILLSSTIYASEAIKLELPLKSKPSSLEYCPQTLESLKINSVRLLISDLIKADNKSVCLLNNPTVLALKDALKASLIKDFRILFLAIFKEHLLYQKVPLKSVVAGGFCADTDHFVLLSKGAIPALTLWSTNDLLSNQHNSRPIDTKNLILPEKIVEIRPNILKTSHKSDRIIIHDRCQQKVQVWHICYDSVPTLVQEASIPLQGDNEVTLSPDGTTLSISATDPIIYRLKEPKLRISRKSSIDTTLNHYPSRQIFSPACISGNGSTLTTKSPIGTAIRWDITSNQPVHLDQRDMAEETPEALDTSGKFLITSRKQNGTYTLLDFTTNTKCIVYQRLVHANPFLIHEPVKINHDGRLATLSLANQDPVLIDLVQKRSTTLPLPSDVLQNNTINALYLNSDSTSLLYLRNNSAYVTSLEYPMNNLTLAELLLIIKLELHGNNLLEDPVYLATYSTLSNRLKDVLCTYFNLTLG